ncbi:amino acid adenylation domain-containing protein [Pigmentibacter sp. JX0631]|uniref:non-ribosomal peptide synthetase n=1 Tax=Pigmentibacter sp. JX0631 TaxID=2976982 RepID=UPI0024687A72|nr:non-ribosomal peptide synthetase [Pigmentibacter sp. JX0631]WGL59179.1 amino acid adenylation domain-containing protein [Pigmentibacter sp. JX0631]
MNNLFDMLEYSAQLNPNKVAFTFLEFETKSECSITYLELSEKAKELACVLQSKLNQSNIAERIILIYPPGLDFIVGFFACIYAGYIAVPVVPPENKKNIDKLNLIINDCDAKVCLSTESLLKKFEEDITNCIPWLDSTLIVLNSPDKWVQPLIKDSDIAFLQYTSGSTGNPKGVMVSHGNIISNLEMISARTATNQDSIMANWLPHFHDMGLINGILHPIYKQFFCLVMSPLSIMIKPFRWLKAISDYKVTISGGPNFAYELLINKINAEEKLNIDLSSWKIAFNGAEPIRSNILIKFVEEFSICGFKKEAIYPCYGLAENCLFVASEKINNGAVINYFKFHKNSDLESFEYFENISEKKDNVKAMVSCGFGHETQVIKIVDYENKSEITDNHIGEIWVRGPSVALGYWNKAELSKEIFQAYLKNGEGPYLRTGDLGFINSDQLFIAGRVKDLIIISGKNYYPQDIEEVFDRIYHNSRNSGNTAAFSIDLFDHEQLVIVTKSIQRMTEVELEDKVAEICNEISKNFGLLVYSILFVNKNCIEKTSSGKIKRQAIRSKYLNRELNCINEWIDNSQQNTNFDKNTNLSSTVFDLASIYSKMLTIWSDILEISASEIKFHSDFFNLGGNSLKIVQIYRVIQKHFGASISIKELYDKTTIGDLSKLIFEKQKNSSDLYQDTLEIEVDSKNRFQPFPLTDVQHAYLIGRNNQYSLSGVSTHGYSEYHFSDLNLPRFEKIWNLLIKRHDSLRLIFQSDLQYVLENVPYYEIKEYDCTVLSEIEIEKHFTFIRNELSHQVFSADKWPLFEIRASKFSDHIILHLSLDALILDMWSVQVLFNEIKDLYFNPEFNLAPLKITFRDYVVNENKRKETTQYKKDEEYWKNRIKYFPNSPQLPIKNSPESIKKTKFKRESWILTNDKWENFKEISNQYKITPAAALGALYASILSVWSSNSKFAINLTLFNRLPVHQQVNSIVGDFTTLLLLEAQCEKLEIFLDQATRLQEQLWTDLEHNLYSGISFQRELTKYQQNKLSSMPIVFTCMLGNENNDFNLLNGREIYGITQTPQVWLDFKVYNRSNNLIIEWDYVENLFPDNLIETMFSMLKKNLLVLSESSKEWSNKLVILPAEQKAQQEILNSTYWHTSEVLLHELFCKQALITPNNIAVINDKKEITYSDLYYSVNVIANELRQLEIKKNEIIAIIMDKGWEQVVACLGIMLSGAAYLPIDSNTPILKIQQILEESDSKIIITQSTNKKIQNELPYSKTIGESRVILLDIFIDKISEKQLNSYPILSSIQSISDLAYVIYTSGSTGKPKGVMIDHKGAVNTILDLNDRFKVTENDRILALSNLNFDLSVYDFFGILAVGGCIVIPSSNKQKNPEYWSDLILKHNISIWNSVPTFMSMLIESLDLNYINKSYLRLILLSGDWIPLDLPEKIRKYFKESEIISLGGATEASIWSIYYPIKSIDKNWKSIPYGKPLRNQHFYVLNDRMENTPHWVVGELYIGGIGLAKGYFNNEEQTLKSFIHHPVTNERLYKTGDLGRYLPDGNIEFLGRKDFQVKVNGFRIELGEIEYNLQQYPGVKKAIVNIVKNNSKLIAYILSDSYVDNDIITNSIERAQFKIARHNIINDLNEPSESILLSIQEDKEQRLSKYFFRKSYRNFDEKISSKKIIEELISRITGYILEINQRKSLLDSLNFEKFSLLLSVLASIKFKEDQLPKYLYPSAGSLYPVQVFIEFCESVHSKSNFYYYHPDKNQLISVRNNSNSSVDLNSQIKVHLIGKQYAIRPMYGKLSTSFCLLESGYILGLLTEQAKELNLELLFQESNGINLRQELNLDIEDTIVSVEISNNLNRQNDKIKNSYNLPDLYVYVKNINETNESQWYLYNFNKELLELVSISIDLKNELLPFGTECMVFNDASLAIFLVGNSNQYVAAGMLSQWLMDEGIKINIGMCPIGIPNQKISKYFMENDNKNILHSLYVGKISDAQKQEKKESKVQENYSFLKDYLKLNLPEYMIPNYFQIIDRVPLSNNGKIDRNLLAIPVDEENLDFNKKVYPVTDLEKKIAKIWSEYLHIDANKIGVYDEFFQIGGNSLTAIKLINHMRKLFNIEIPFQKIFELQTISELSNLIIKMQKVEM